jgi:acetyl esterase/lipase
VTDVLTRPPLPADNRIAYGSDASHFGDLRLPAGDGPHPVAIVIHGGFWRAQWSLEHASHECVALTAEGLATWSLEYRRVGHIGGGWPGTFDDIRGGSAHLAELAEQHRLDLERVVVVGHSAGGHLALWLAMQAKSLPFRLKGAVALAGVVDLRRAAEMNLGRGAVQDFLGGEPNQVPERYAAASPIEHVPLGVPVALIHGEDDASVPIELAERYFDAAASTGDYVELIRLPQTGHFEVIDPISHAWPGVLQGILRLSE